MTEQTVLNADDPVVNADELREQVKEKYREVATTPQGNFHFHVGRKLAQHLGYAPDDHTHLPEGAVESFAGVANPFSLRELGEGEVVLDLGSGSGFDSFVAAGKVGDTGRVIGIDMTREMLDKARTWAGNLGLNQVEFREGLLEALPLDDASVDVAISNGVINLCPDKRQVFAEILRVLKPGGVLQFADIANGRPVPEAALENVDLWTA